MRIAMISIGAPDAQDRQVQLLASALAGRGHQVGIHTGDETGPVPRGIADLGRYGRWLGETWTGSGTLPDVVHVHSWHGCVAALAATRLPLVLTSQGTEELTPAGAVCAAADRIIVRSDSDAGHLAGYGIEPERIRHIPSGVDTSVFHPGRVALASGPLQRVLAVADSARTDRARTDRARTAWARTDRARNDSVRNDRARSYSDTSDSVTGEGGRTNRAGGEYAGNGGADSDCGDGADGLADLIRALPQLPEAELVIAGGPPRHRLAENPVAQRLLTLARELWVDGRVLMLGDVPHERMPALYRSADVLASVRGDERSSVIPVEAMACGVPVVAYRCGDVQDTVVDGRTGLLIEPGDVFGLTRSLSETLADQLTRIRQGNAARRRAEEQFAWPRIAQRLEQAYREAMALASPGAIAIAR
jgi:glycosyltransferase involved in cell wall biosynthesis